MNFGLRTLYFVKDAIKLTCAAKSTLIRENDVNVMCSLLNFGRRDRPLDATDVL